MLLRLWRVLHPKRISSKSLRSWKAERLTLVDRAAEGAKVFYINGNKIMEGEGETTVEKTGVYRIEMDFSIASVTVREVSKMEFYFCPSGAATFELPYVGNGVFCGQDKIEFKQEGWGRDQRYKFLMTYADGSIQYWGTKNTTDSNPGAATPEDPYFYIMETPDNQWIRSETEQ